MNKNTAISTKYPVGSIVPLIYTIDDGVPYWKISNYDVNTRNTVGDSTKNSTKLYIVGSKTTDGSDSSSYATSYTNSNIFINTNNVLESSKGFKGDLTGNATSADSATYALEANNATYATNAGHATGSDSATNAANANNANHATNADNATHATSADNATHATSADLATHANTATDADWAETADYAAKAGHANAATKATQAEKDSSERNIVNTYETKSDANNKLSEAKTYTENYTNTALNNYYTKGEALPKTTLYAASDAVGGKSLSSKISRITSSIKVVAFDVPLNTEKIYFCGSDGINLDCPQNYCIITIQKGDNHRTILDCYHLSTGDHYINGNMCATNDSGFVTGSWTGWVKQPNNQDVGYGLFEYDGDLSLVPIASAPDGAISITQLKNSGQQKVKLGDFVFDKYGHLGRVNNMITSSDFEAELVVNFVTASELNEILNSLNTTISNIQTDLAGKVGSDQTWDFTSIVKKDNPPFDHLSGTNLEDFLLDIDGRIHRPASTAFGNVKSGGDVTISNGIITVNDDSHNHTISNIDNLSTRLNNIETNVSTAQTNITNLTADVPKQISAHNESEEAHEDIRTVLAEVKEDVDNFFKDASLAEAAIDTLKEIQTYISEDKTGAAAMNEAIAGKAPKDHASSGTTYGKGTSDKYGHLKLSDSTSSTSSTTGGIAATPKAVNSALTSAKSYADGLKNTIDTNLASNYYTIENVDNKFKEKETFYIDAVWDGVGTPTFVGTYQQIKNTMDKGIQVIVKLNIEGYLNCLLPFSKRIEIKSEDGDIEAIFFESTALGFCGNPGQIIFIIGSTNECACEIADYVDAWQADISNLQNQIYTTLTYYYTKSQIDSYVFITEADIDEICGTVIQTASDEGVVF